MANTDRKPNILVTNDDGISAEGIRILAEHAKRFGNVTVLAPAEQCSGMSVKLTIHQPMEFRACPDFPVEGVKAYSLKGTPADCAKLAIRNIMPEKPDYVFSGINFGLNAGFDCLYSGTVGAIMEALTFGVKGIAFSTGFPASALWDSKADYEVFEKYADDLIEELMHTEIEKSAFWNVNFPGCPLSEFKGILRGRKLSQVRPYDDTLQKDILPDGTAIYTLIGNLISGNMAPEGTDIHAVLNGHISVGKVFNAFIE